MIEHANGASRNLEKKIENDVMFWSFTRLTINLSRHMFGTHFFTSEEEH